MGAEEKKVPLPEGCIFFFSRGLIFGGFAFISDFGGKKCYSVRRAYSYKYRVQDKYRLNPVPVHHDIVVDVLAFDDAVVLLCNIRQLSTDKQPIAKANPDDKRQD